MSGAARRLELGDFVCPYHFGAGLPPLPADPKLLEIDFERASFVRFRFDSAVEMSAKYELLPEPDLGITIDLVDPEAFAAAAPGTELDAADEELLSASAFAQALGERKGIAAVAKEMRENVTFLRKTPIMSNNLYDSVNKFQKVNMESKPVLETSKHLAMTTNTTRTLAQQIEAIEKSFDDAETINVRSSTLVHPSDPSLTPVSSVPVLPDYAGWDNRYSIMTFDVDPSLSKPGDLEVAYARERIGRALCKGFSRKEQDKNEMYLAYMLPPAREEGADEALEEDVPLEWVREYQYTLAKRDTSAQDTYYLAIGETVASYNPIESRIAMARKSYRTKSARPSPITFSRRTVNEDEAESQNQRRLLLRGPGDTGPLRITHSVAPAAAEDEDEAAPAADEPDGFEMDDEDAAQADEPLLQDALPAAEGEGVPAGTDEDDEEEGDGMIIDDDA